MSEHQTNPGGAKPRVKLVKKEITLHPLLPPDTTEIRGWPPYEGEFKPLDYALREGGWLDAMPESPSTRQFAVRSEGRLIGFSILTDIREGAAEIYLAVHPSHLGQGLGRQIMQSVLRIAFEELKLLSVHLKVRSWHTRAIALYERLGFVTTGEKRETVQGEMVTFRMMQLGVEAFKAGSR